jgi:hypothetical protein
MTFTGMQVVQSGLILVLLYLTFHPMSTVTRRVVSALLAALLAGQLLYALN